MEMMKKIRSFLFDYYEHVFRAHPFPLEKLLESSFLYIFICNSEEKQAR